MKHPYSLIQKLTLVVTLATCLSACQSASEVSSSPEEGASSLTSEESAVGDTSEMRIALSMSFVERSSYRQAMVDSFTKAATDAQDQGLLSDFTVVDAERDTEQQAQQVQTLIAEDYDAILMVPNSVSELDEVVKAACDAEILVVNIGAEVNEPCAYTVSTVWNQYGAVQGSYLGTRLQQGNVLEVRGVKGSTSDTDISAAVHAALAQFPGLKVVDTVHGNWTQEIAQQEVATVLPSLPEIDAVVTQGGDGYGTALAFAQSDRPMPIILMGNRHDELKWWQEQRDATGYTTISASATPGMSAVALWTAQQILAGKEVPQFLELPVLIIEEDELDAWLSITPEGGVANADYTLDWTIELIDAHTADTPLPSPPFPDAP